MKTLLMVLLIGLAGCIGTQTHYDALTGNYQEIDFDNSFVNSSSKNMAYFKCDKGLTIEKVLAGLGNCKANDKIHADTTGMVPSLAGPALNGVIGAAILEDSFGSNTNVNVGGTTTNNGGKRGRGGHRGGRGDR